MDFIVETAAIIACVWIVRRLLNVVDFLHLEEIEADKRVQHCKKMKKRIWVLMPIGYLVTLGMVLFAASIESKPLAIIGASLFSCAILSSSAADRVIRQCNQIIGLHETRNSPKDS